MQIQGETPEPVLRGGYDRKALDWGDDMSGNVAVGFRLPPPDYYGVLAASGEIAVNPQGPQGKV